MNSWVTLVEIDWDGGTEYYSGDGVSMASQFYQPRLINVGSVTREVTLPSKGMVTATCSIALANEDNYFSAKRAAESWYGRIVRVMFGDLLSPSAIITVFTGQVTDWSMAGHQLSLSIRDNYAELFSNTINGRFVSSTFPNLPGGTNPTVIPIIYGLASWGAGAAGILPCVLVDPKITDAKYVYVLCRHRCYDTSALEVYSGGVLKATPVDYTITTGTYGAYTCTLIKFTADQRPNAVTAQYVTGWDNVTNLNNLDEQVISFLEDVVGIPSGDIDTASFTAAVTGIPVDAAHSDTDCWIGEDIPISQYLDRWAESANASIYRTREGKIGLFLFVLPRESLETGGTALGVSDIANLAITPNDRVASRVQANCMYNWVSQYFYKQEAETGTIEAIELGQVTQDTFDLYHKYFHTGAWVSKLERRYLSREGLFHASFEVLPKFWTLDLWSLISITHPDGVGAGGWVDQQARITSITLDPSLSSPRLFVKAKAFPVPRGTDSSQVFWYVTAEHVRSSPSLDPADGAAVGTWSDMCVGFAYSPTDLTQATGGNQPLYRANVGGFPCIDFDGTDDHLDTANPLPFDSLYRYIFYLTVVFKADATAAGDHVICCQTAAGVMKCGIYHNGTSLRCTVNGGTNYAVGTIAAGTWYVVTARYNGVGGFANTTRLWINGVEQTPDNTTMVHSTGPLCLGASTDGTEPFDGQIREAMCYWDQSVAADADQLHRKMLEKALGEKYGITITP